MQAVLGVYSSEQDRDGADGAGILGAQAVSNKNKKII
jgi:hypothetical protein